VYSHDFSKLLATNPVADKVDKGTSDIQEFNFAMARGEVPEGQSFTDWLRKNKQAGASSVHVGLQAPMPMTFPDGSVQMVQPANRPGAPAQVLKDPVSGKPLTPIKPSDSPKSPNSQDARQSAGALARLESSMEILDRVGKTKPSALSPGLPQELVRSVTEMGANYLTSADRQKVESAQLDALDAALWLATGAAYNKEQLRGLTKAYFPQVGDKAGVQAEKKAKLDVVIKSARIRAGAMAGDQTQNQAPTGVPYEVWNAMTPEERALWPKK